ncbi:MAG TPA: caspase family protein [Pyrinomonadaceae bacterium]|nr:caspase family protein [Pyrinomonadaceae bacterium]
MMRRHITFLALRRSEDGARFARYALISLACLLTIMLHASSAISQDYLFEQDPKRVALVIGNANYKNLSSIASSISDAEMMRQRLTELGFDVVYYPDVPTLSNFEDVVLPDFRRKINVGDLVVFYFSGHGFSFGPDNFLAPTDLPLSITTSKVTSYAISVDAFKDLIASHKPGLIMFFIDACRSIGGFIINDEQGRNLVSKGYKTPQVSRQSINTFIVYATKPGEIAEGFSNPEQLSIFTKALTEHIGTEGEPFRSIFDEISAEVVTSTSGTQDPGKIDWSKTDPYLKPTLKNLEDQREVWRSTLESRDPKKIEIFGYRYSVSRHSAACRKWLDDSLNNELAARYTSASPFAIDRAWSSHNMARLSVRRLSISSIAFTRSLEESQEQDLRNLSDTAIGLVPSGTSKPSGDSLEFSLASIDAHKTVVATQTLVGRADPDISATIVERIPTGTQLQVDGITSGTDKNIYLRATTPGDTSSVFIRVPETLATPAPLELGQSLKEIIVPPRPHSIPELVNPVPIQEAIADLKAQGWKITWVSLSTAQIEDQAEQETRAIRLVNAEYILKDAGIDGRRVTSVAGKADFSGDGVRIRFFGIR